MIENIKYKLLKTYVAIFLVFLILFLQVPDVFWQLLHNHKHHDCGLQNIIHNYTPDCNLEQRFLLPWDCTIIKPTITFFNLFFSEFDNLTFIPFILEKEVKIHRNKAPPH